MPNVGKPSKGCQDCRSRKVKCDQKRPSCSQCIRAGKVCHGYRDALSMMFRNENEVVAKKAEKRYEVLAKQKITPPLKKKELATPESESSEDWEFGCDPLPASMNMQVVSRTRYPTPESMCREIVPSIEAQAIGFFLGNYVARPKIMPRGQFEWVTKILKQPNTEAIVQYSINATSLAGFANATKNPVIMQQARAAYVTALRMTNNALLVQETAIKDSTLMSVIMLGLYENFVFQDKRSIQAWARHVDGACALFNLRGKDQLQSITGKTLFLQFYGIVMLVALETGRCMHSGMHELYLTMTAPADYSVYGVQWNFRFVDVMYKSINLKQDRHTDPKTMVATAFKIDHEIDEMKVIMPEIWTYEAIELEQLSEHLFNRTYNIYLDPWIAQMWNNLNSCRLGLLAVIRENLTKGWTRCDPPVFSQEEYESNMIIAEELIRSTSADIVASVPQITGMLPFPDPPSAVHLASNPKIDESSRVHKLHPPGTFLDPTRSNYLVHVIWPLYSASKIDLATPEMRQWAIEILHYVALRIGNRQAVVFADELSAIQRNGMFTTPFVDRTTLSLEP
ncbi:hypothetical protein GQ44DRAFT_614082 [Phaeosphaeriaceae sp. PMI808]|nr:hypothetical protein GQ44DRAFT_614082 [Phaeosphaeriaceae sp. PMI808]